MSDFDKCIHKNICRYAFPCLHGVENISCEHYEESKQGEWIANSTGFRCSVCGLQRNVSAYDMFFCPHCGADMRKEGDEK